MRLIPLQGSAGIGKNAMVDDEDYPLLSRITWNITDHGYAKSTNGNIYMHFLIFGLSVGPHGTIDHKDRNKLNNQKTNLRHATKQRQMMNQGKSRRVGSSIYKGVCAAGKRNKSKPWMAIISKKFNGVQKTYFLGYFISEVDAAKAYDSMAHELFGEFAYLNFPQDVQP